MARIKGVAMMNAVKALRAQKERARSFCPDAATSTSGSRCRATGGGSFG
jgi:hypothetical protein